MDETRGPAAAPGASGKESWIARRPRIKLRNWAGSKKAASRLGSCAASGGAATRIRSNSAAAPGVQLQGDRRQGGGLIGTVLERLELMDSRPLLG